MPCGRYMRCSLHYLQRLQHFARVGIKGVNIDLARAIRTVVILIIAGMMSTTRLKHGRR